MRNVAVTGLVLATLLTNSCDRQPQRTAEPERVATQRLAPSLSVTPHALDKNRVELTIATNLPLPVTVATSIDLDGQAPTDTYIGYEGGRVVLQQPTTKIVFDTSLATKALPAGRYLASVSFHPKWGAEGNPDAQGAPELHADVPFMLQASGKSVAWATLRDRRQAWIMENLNSNAPWNKRAFEQRLGASEKGPSDLSPLHDAYYYPGADVTLIVNRLRNEVSIWRLGRATK